MMGTERCIVSTRDENNDSNDGHDFECREPELKFSEEANAEIVDTNYRNPEYCDEDSWVDTVTVLPCC